MAKVPSSNPMVSKQTTEIPRPKRSQEPIQGPEPTPSSPSYKHQWVSIQSQTMAMEVEGLGVIVGVPNALTFIPGAVLDGIQIKPKGVRSANVEETNPLGTEEEKTGFPQDEDDPFGFRG